MISLSIPCLSAQTSAPGGIHHVRVETRLTDLVDALERIEDGDNGSRPRSSDQMRTALVSMLLSDNDLSRCITAISRTVDDGAHEDFDTPAIAAIVDAVRMLARYPEWEEFAAGLRTIRDVVGVNPSDVERETNTRRLLCDAEQEAAALRGQVATLTRERDEARAHLIATRDLIWSKDIPSPTTSEYREWHENCQRFMGFIEQFTHRDTAPTPGAQA